MRAETIKLIQYIIRNKQNRIYCHKIANDTGMMFSTVYTSLILLERLKFIKRKKEGRTQFIELIHEPTNADETLQLLINLANERNSLHKNLPNMRQNLPNIHRSEKVLQ